MMMLKFSAKMLYSIKATTALAPFSLYRSISFKSPALLTTSPSSFQPPQSCPPPLYPFGRPPHSCRPPSSESIPAPNPATLVESFHVWITRHQRMWDVKKLRNRGIGPDFQPFLRSLLLALEDIHMRGAYHGNLLDGIYVNKENKVVLANFQVAKWPFAYGMVKDLLDVKQLVEKSITQHPPSNELPFTVKFFFDLYDHFPDHYNMRGLRDAAFYIYHSPIAWDWSVRYGCIRTLWLLYRSNIRYFSCLLRDDQGVRIPELRYWWHLLKPKTRLYEVLMHPTRKNPNFKIEETKTCHSAGILFFFRDAFEHYYFPNKSGFGIREIEAELFDLFPDAYARLFVLFQQCTDTSIKVVKRSEITMTQYYKRELTQCDYSQDIYRAMVSKD